METTEFIKQQIDRIAYLKAHTERKIAELQARLVSLNAQLASATSIQTDITKDI